MFSEDLALFSLPSGQGPERLVFLVTQGSHNTCEPGCDFCRLGDGWCSGNCYAVVDALLPESATPQRLLAFDYSYGDELLGGSALFENCSNADQPISSSIAAAAGVDLE